MSQLMKDHFSTPQPDKQNDFSFRKDQISPSLNLSSNFYKKKNEKMASPNVQTFTETTEFLNINSSLRCLEVQELFNFLSNFVNLLNNKCDSSTFYNNLYHFVIKSMFNKFYHLNYGLKYQDIMKLIPKSSQKHIKYTVSATKNGKLSFLEIPKGNMKNFV